MAVLPTSYLVRTTRARIIRLRNDHKGLLLKCEEGLHAFHASMRDASPETLSSFRPTSTSRGPPNLSNSGVAQVPFARVSAVMPQSPAEEAGLKVGDRIKSFGAVNSRNHEKLGKIAELVRTNEDVNIAHCPRKQMGGANVAVIAQYHCGGGTGTTGQSAARRAPTSAETTS
jgi:hypothetical protein